MDHAEGADNRWRLTRRKQLGEHLQCGVLGAAIGLNECACRGPEAGAVA